MAVPVEAKASCAAAGTAFCSSLLGIKVKLQLSRVVVTTMHQGQQSSLPNCGVVQRGE